MVPPYPGSPDPLTQMGRGMLNIVRMWHFSYWNKKDVKKFERDWHRRRAVKCLGDKCNLCGKKYPEFVYEFHHIEPRAGQESDLISVKFNRRWSFIKKELEGCELLCANCHKVRHWGE